MPTILPARCRVAAVLAAYLALAACSSASSSGGGAAYGTGDPSLAAANPGGGAIDPFLSDGEAVLHALDAVAAKSGKPFRVISLNADRINGLTVHVQEPAQHVNVDQYVIAPDGTMTGPTPVKMIGTRHGAGSRSRGLRSVQDRVGRADRDGTRRNRQVALQRRARNRVGIRRGQPRRSPVYVPRSSPGTPERDPGRELSHRENAVLGRG